MADDVFPSLPRLEDLCVKVVGANGSRWKPEHLLGMCLFLLYFLSLIWDDLSFNAQCIIRTVLKSLYSVINWSSSHIILSSYNA